MEQRLSALPFHFNANDIWSKFYIFYGNGFSRLHADMFRNRSEISVRTERFIRVSQLSLSKESKPEKVVAFQLISDKNNHKQSG